MIIPQNLEHAVECYLSRQNRKEVPSGYCDDEGRWFPFGKERKACCKRVIQPTRMWTRSLLTHCRTMDHVAHLYGVTLHTLRAAVHLNGLM